MNSLYNSHTMNILLTSVGRRTYLINYFKEALDGDGMVHAANSIYTHSLSCADQWVLTPQIYDEEYTSFLLRYCQDNKISAIISLFDIDLPILAAQKDVFMRHGVTIIVSDLSAINLCNDKWLTYRFLNKHDIRTPWTSISLLETKEALSSGIISFPIMMKPRWGMGSIGIYQIDDLDEMEILYRKLHRQIFSTYLKFESEYTKDSCIIFQEKIHGDEYGLDVLNDLQGHYVTTVAKKKIAMRAGETDIAEIVDPTPFKPIGQALSTCLGHIANLDVDCFRDSLGEIYVLELNCRFGGQYPFSHLAGVNFPKQIIAWLSHKPTETTLITPVIGCRGCKELTPVKL